MNLRQLKQTIKQGKRRRISLPDDQEKVQPVDSAALPPPPAALPVPTAPGSIDDALDDLARETAAHLALVRCQRERRGGLVEDRINEAIPVDLPNGWIAPLAQGLTLTMGGREWTAPMLCVHADLPLDQWRQLRDAARAWRLARLALVPANFPLARLPELEDQLPTLAARLLACLLLQQAGNDINLSLLRSGFRQDVSGLEEWANALGDERADRRRADLQGIFGPEGTAVALGVFDPPSAEERTSDPKTWEPRLCSHQVAALLGEPIELLARTPGVTVVRPAERLGDVVLTSDQARLVQGIDTAWSNRAGATNALAVLLHGPSGTGKTLVARALAGERGVPLILLDGSASRDEDEHLGEGVGGRITGLVRRAATDHAILFIDEADDLLREGSEVSRSFLLALERHPAVVLVATNKPLAFDPALDRRLQIKIHMDIPGPVERAAILRLELERAGLPLAPGLVQGESLARLAEGARLSGGHWRSVVQVAGMLAGARGGAAATPVAIGDLADALRLQVADEQVVDTGRTTRVRWIERPRRAEGATWGARLERFAALCGALTTLRTGRIARVGAGSAGIGALLVVQGPDRELAGEVSEALAAELHLPLARVGDGGHATHQRDETDELPGKHLGWKQVTMQIYGQRRPGSRFTAHRHDRPDTAAQRWEERDIIALLHDLGGCSVLHLEVDDAEAVAGLLPLVDACAVSPHLTVIHLVDGSVPPDLRRRAAAVLPWAAIDPALRRLRWAAVGGTGEPPQATATAELAAAATRQVLAGAGFVPDLAAGVLP
jgi:hypothetical protein